MATTYTDARFRERKEELYRKRVPGYHAMINAWLPLFAVIAVWGLITDITGGAALGRIIFDGLWLCFTLIVTFLARSPDTTAFWLLLVYVSVFLVRNVGTSFLAIISAAAVGAAGNNAAWAAGGIGGAIVANGVAMGLGLVLLAEIFAIGLCAAWAIYYIAVLIRHKDFFLLDPKQLRKKYE